MGAKFQGSGFKTEDFCRSEWVSDWVCVWDRLGFLEFAFLRKQT